MAQLLVNEAGQLRVEIVDKPVIIIGRNPETDVQINLDSVSPFHCQIKQVGSEYRVVDLNTATGTFVNGIGIHEQVLRSEDMIQIGEASIVFHVEQKPERENHLDLSEDADYSLEMDWEQEGEEPTSYFDFTALQRDQVRNFLNLNMPINTSPDLNILLDRMIGSVLDLTSSTSGMFLVRDERFRLVPRCQRKLPKDSLQKAIQLILRPVARKVVETHGLVSIPDIDEELFLDLRGEQFPEYQTILGIPLRTMAKEYGVLNQDLAHLHPANRTLGVLLLMRHKGQTPFTDQEIPMIEAVSHQVAVSIFNLKLHLMASADPMTGLYNRNYFQSNISEEIEFSRMGKTQLSVAITDVDHFKRFNELYGAKAADGILKSIGRIVLGPLRDIDIVARYGGEKFIFMFLHMGHQGALEIMEQVRQEIQAFPFLEEGYKITVSSGIASFPAHGTTPEQLIERADQALYRAKQSGKNQSVVWEKEKNLAGERTDDLAGLVSGNIAKDYQHMQALMETIRLNNATPDPQEQVYQLVDKIMEVTYSERAMIFQSTPQGIKPTLARDRLGQSLEEEHMPPYSNLIVSRVLESRCALHEVWHPSLELQDNQTYDETYNRSVLCAPLREKEKDLGVLYVDSPDVDREITDSDVTFFDAIAKQIALALTQVQLREQLKDRERMQYEFNIASTIQNDLLPSEFPALPGISIYGYTEPAKEVGGDYYDVISTPFEDPQHFLCIGDVSGKGLPAGLVMVMARSALRPLITTGSILSPAELLYHLNGMIYENTSSGVFMSMLLLEILPDGIEYASAGHEHILVYRKAQKKVEAIRSGGVVLGLSPYVPMFENKFLPMDPGDFLLLYTDGATEAQNTKGEEFELEHLVELTERYGNQEMTCQEMVGYIFSDIKNFFTGVDQLDDITLLIAKRTEG